MPLKAICVSVAPSRRRPHLHLQKPSLVPHFSHSSIIRPGILLLFFTVNIQRYVQCSQIMLQHFQRAQHKIISHCASNVCLPVLRRDDEQSYQRHAFALCFLRREVKCMVVLVPDAAFEIMRHRLLDLDLVARSLCLFDRFFQRLDRRSISPAIYFLAR